MRLRALSLAVAVLAGWLGLAAAQAPRPPCSEVVKAIDHARENNDGRPADPVKVGRRLHVSPIWVSRCAQVYGRGVKPLEPAIAAQRSKWEEKWESEEPGEFAREDHDAGVDEEAKVKPPEEERKGRITGDTAEWEPFVTHEWDPVMPQEWDPFLHDDDIGIPHAPGPPR
jgi:hypothetical protein